MGVKPGHCPKIQRIFRDKILTIFEPVKEGGQWRRRYCGI
jgi:hypothetical protein